MTAPKLDCEAYPGELAELRAIRASVVAHGCLQCQLRASIAARGSPHRPNTLRVGQHAALLRIVVKERK